MFDALTRYWPLPEKTAAPVVCRAGQGIGYDAFKNDILAARRALSRLGSPKVVLFEPDVYAFAVWLMAAWSLGVSVILPGDDLTATREALAFPWLGRNHEKNALQNWRAETPASSANDVEPREFGIPTLLLFTSGSSGKPGLIEKSLPQLRREIEALEQVFGATLTPGKTRFVSSVPHQHMYGLPFAVLWPLTFSYPMMTEKLHYPEDLWRLPAADYVLISAPTFLKHLPQPAEAAFTAASGIHWQLATSAGSPLETDVQARCQTLLNAPLFEIYGSTETGAVARRQGGNASWQAMPGVRLSVDADTSRLRIHSPFLTPEAAETGFLSNDLARIDARGLELIGRADRIVKVGEKRISLSKVEAALMALAEVERASVVSFSGARDALGAVVILTSAGEARKAALGKARFDRYLRAALRDQLETLSLPRRWRYVDALPVNDMGKTTQRDLQRLFAPQLPQAECVRQSQEGSVGKVRLQLHCAPDLIWFEGHFPNLPVLPGVAQIDWAAHFGRLHFGFDAPVTRMTGLKFQYLIRPSDTPCLDLTWRPDRQELEFAYFLDEKPCSRGTLALRKALAGGEIQ
jgi:3-hydroxymyristoyl/3-hydroxydecanoyl-(acyl carrier protein) dehydratase